MSSLPYPRLGPYTILERLGAGGMGEVYRARDTRLEREVALKVLPPHLSSDPERRRRLEREARLVSRLNHPRICQIYDIGHDDGVDYLVMEYLKGETLSARLKRGALPMRELFNIALEVTEALEAAHLAGLVHRDLKPANIALTESGAKLLDFSIARLAVGPMVDDGPRAPASASGPPEGSLTLTGAVVGSLPYISPEQIQGHEADARSDVFALGATLFEMATGRRAFEGADQTERIEAILRRRVQPVSDLRPRTPAGFSELVGRCLEKDPAERWPDAGALRRELDRLATLARAHAQDPNRRRRRLTIGLVAAGALALGLLGLWRATEVLRLAPAPLHALIGAPDSARFLLTGDTGGPPVLSPDGTRLAFVAVDAEGLQQVWLRPLGGLRATPVSGTEDARFPFWSPDGRSLAFFTVSHLVRVDLDTGRRTELCGAPSGRGGSWGSRGSIVFAPVFRSGIYVVPATGGEPREAVARDSVRFTTFRWPHFLPDGRTFVFFAARHTTEKLPPGGLESLPAVRGGVFLASLDDPRPRLLRATESEAIPAGNHLLFAQGGRLMGQRLVASSGALAGTAFPTGETVHADTTTWKLNATVSGNGTLAYDEHGPLTGYEVVWLDRAGAVIGKTGTRADHVNLRLSPDGRRLAVETRENNVSRVWLWELEPNARRLVDLPEDAIMPCWTRDGRALVLARNKAPGTGLILYWHPLEGGEPGNFLSQVEDNNWPEDFDPAGNELLGGNGGYSIERRGRLVVYHWTHDRTPRGLRRPPITAWAQKLPERVDRARISPDGRWFAYTMRDAGREEIFLSPFRPALLFTSWEQLPRRRLSLNGGSRPRWRADGRELYFVRGHSTMVARATEWRGDSLVLGPEQELFRVTQRPSRNSYDVTPDGQRFVLVTLGQEREAPIVVVSNWLATLDARR